MAQHQWPLGSHMWPCITIHTTMSKQQSAKTGEMSFPKTRAPTAHTHVHLQPQASSNDHKDTACMPGVCVCCRTKPTHTRKFNHAHRCPVCTPNTRHILPGRDLACAACNGHVQTQHPTA